MVSTEQARRIIWDAIEAWRGGDDGQLKGPYAFARAAGMKTPSMLYQFARDKGPCLGSTTVNAIAPLLPDVSNETWLAAMGVQGTSAESSEAVA